MKKVANILRSISMTVAVIENKPSALQFLSGFPCTLDHEDGGCHVTFMSGSKLFIAFDREDRVKSVLFDEPEDSTSLILSDTHKVQFSREVRRSTHESGYFIPYASDNHYIFILKEGVEVMRLVNENGIWHLFAVKEGVTIGKVITRDQYRNDLIERILSGKYDSIIDCTLPE